MKLEHIGYQVPDPVAAAEWYVRHLGFRLVRSGGPPANARFLFDSAGASMIEIYNNPAVSVPDYPSMDPLLLHLALCVDDVRGAAERLVAAGATRAGDVTVTDAGDEFIMLRDPWGVPLQLMKRRAPMA